MPKRKENMQFWNVIVDRVCLWHWQISPDINKSPSIDVILNNLHPLFISRLLVYSGLFYIVHSLWKLRFVHLWSGTFLEHGNSLGSSIKYICINTVKIDPPCLLLSALGHTPSVWMSFPKYTVSSGTLNPSIPYLSGWPLLAGCPFWCHHYPVTWWVSAGLEPRFAGWKTAKAWLLLSAIYSRVEHFPDLHLGKIDRGWTRLIFLSVKLVDDSLQCFDTVGWATGRVSGL